jgi:hypothetical protein
MQRIIIFFTTVLLILPLAAHAAEPANPPTSKPSADAPPPPPAPKEERRPANQPDTGLEPEVTIVTRGDVKYEEYRVRGRHYMTKVTPKFGKPYYLVDKEGQGQFRRSDIEPSVTPPSWVILSW